MNSEEYGIVEVKKLSTSVADRLSEMIQTGILKPGEHLVQMELCRRFGISRIAVRDALQLLKQKGLAVDIPRKGIVVRTISVKTVRDIFTVRRVVEGQAIREACDRLTPQDLEHLDQIIKDQEDMAQKADMARLIEKDWEFHQFIYYHCDNEPLMDIIILLWSRTRQARGLAQSDVNWGKEWGKHSSLRHRRVLDALVERNAAKASRLMMESITMAEEGLVKGLREAGWGGEDSKNGIL